MPITKNSNLELVREARSHRTLSGWMVEAKDFNAALTAQYLQHGFSLTNETNLTGQPTSPVTHIGNLSLQEQNRPFFSVAAIDGILTDGKNIVVIERRDEPGKGKFTLSGGFIDDSAEKAAMSAIREIAEETGVFLDQAYYNATLSEKRLTDRTDVRQIQGEYLSNKGLHNGDVMAITTSGTLIHVPDLDYYREQVVAGDDAKKAQVVDITTLIDQGTGIEDHLELIMDSALKQPELFDRAVIRAVIDKRLETLEDRILTQEKRDFVAKELYANYQSGIWLDNTTYQALEARADNEITLDHVREKIAKQVAYLNDTINRRDISITQNQRENLEVTIRNKLERLFTEDLAGLIVEQSKIQEFYNNQLSTAPNPETAQKASEVSLRVNIAQDIVKERYKELAPAAINEIRLNEQLKKEENQELVREKEHKIRDLNQQNVEGISPNDKRRITSSLGAEKAELKKATRTIHVVEQRSKTIENLFSQAQRERSLILPTPELNTTEETSFAGKLSLKRSRSNSNAEKIGR